MPIAFNLELLIPVVVGIGCLFFAMRILFRKETHEEAHIEEPEAIDEDDEDFDMRMPSRNEGLEPGRKVFYVLLFAGLGAASIVFGFAALFPVLGYAAKGIIALTIIVSIIANAQIDKKLQAEQQEPEAQNPKTDV